MEITIDKDCRIVSDEHNWIVQFKLKNPQIFKDTGQVIAWSNWGFFISLESAVHRLIEHKIRLIPFSDINRILKSINKIQHDFSLILKPYEIKVSINH